MCLFGVYTGLIFFQSCKIRANLDFAVSSLFNVSDFSAMLSSSPHLYPLFSLRLHFISIIYMQEDDEIKGCEVPI